MGKRKEVVPVNLSPQQRRELERLWFVFGNYGPKTTKGNHSLIQGLLERGQDERPLRLKGYIPTEECERAVERVLHLAEQQEKAVADKTIAAEGTSAEENSQLRSLVHAETRKPITLDS